MTEQPEVRLSPPQLNPAGTLPQKAAERPSELHSRPKPPQRLPATPEQGTSMTGVDEQRLNQIRAKLRRIAGNEQLSPKQFEALQSLVQELLSLESPGGSPLDDDIFK
jgi:hypothetical protein